jgi:HSP20 family protein
MAKAKKKETETNVIPATTRFPSASDDFARLFQDMFPGGLWSSPFERRQMPLGARIPKVDIIDEEDHVKLIVEAPGVNKEDLDVSVNDHTVTIRGKTESRDETKEANFYRCEIEQGEFSRTLSLPAEVIGDKSNAKLVDGLLEVTIPKREQSKRRSIKIN